MKRSDDHFLFAWMTEGTPEDRTSNASAGLVARSPRDFSELGNIRRLEGGSVSLPYSITNRGLQISLPLDRSSYIPLTKTKHVAKKVSAFETRPIGKNRMGIPKIVESHMTVAQLNCQISVTPGQPIGVVLWVTEKGYFNSPSFPSHHSADIFSSRGGQKRDDIHLDPVCKLLDLSDISPTRPERREIGIPLSLPCEFSILELYPSSEWTGSESALRVDTNCRELRRGPAVVLLESSGYRLAVFFQEMNRRFYAHTVYCRTERARLTFLTVIRGI
jgi:hypothetical protein